MTDTILIWVGIVAVAFGLRWVVRRKLDDARAFREYQDEFFVHAHRLADDERVPSEVLDCILMLGREITSRSIMRAFARDVLSGRIRRVIRNKEGRYRFNELLKQIPPDLKQVYDRACAAWVLALTRNHIFLGPFIRNVVLFAFVAQSERRENGSPMDHQAQAVIYELPRGRLKVA